MRKLLIKLNEFIIIFGGVLQVNRKAKIIKTSNRREAQLSSRQVVKNTVQEKVIVPSLDGGEAVGVVVYKGKPNYNTRYMTK